MASIPDYQLLKVCFAIIEKFYEIQAIWNSVEVQLGNLLPGLILLFFKCDDSFS
jgi:hypothetical protein